MNKDKNEAIIHFNNEIYGIFALNRENTIHLDTLVTIVIFEGKAKISFSTCKDQLCVNQGWSNKQPIVCVPNKTMIDFHDEKDDKDNRIFITH
ncbi:MAG: NusG domain II-containing protein [Candidatus Cloacimonetes bacterium]|nr:NusG domain II-containing protein [Candidatus Cloacimonadota bacterium]